MFDQIRFFYLSILEQQNFPGWELYVFFTTSLLVSIIFRLNRIEGNQNGSKTKE